MRSIQSRLAAGLLLSLIILLVTQWVIVGLSIRHLSEQYIISRLVHDSDALIAALNLQNSNQPLLDKTRIHPIYLQPFSGYYYKIVVGKETFRSRSLWDEDLVSGPVGAGVSAYRRSKGPLLQQLLILDNKYEKQGSIIRVTIAEDISSIDVEIDRFLFNHGIVSFFILIVLIAMQAFLVRRSLKPLEQVRKDLEKLETGIVEVLSEDVPTELYPLVREINYRLKALRHRVERSRHASGNLAHALKGPLTLLTQLAQRDEIKSQTKIQQIIVQQTSDIHRIIDRELKIARMAGTAVAGRQTKLAPELKDLVDTLNSMYREKALNINYKVPEGCICLLDREDLHEMLGNLLDNACKWAKNKITINISCEDNFSIVIEDDGPGIPEKQQTQILLRGKRLDENKLGHGLGLSIVKSIVEQYNGKIKLSRSPTLGGLATNIEFPKKLK